MFKKRISAYLYLSSAMIIVSSSFPIGKLAVADLPIFILSGGRYFVALFLLIPILWKNWEKFKAISKQDYLLLGLQAFFGVWIFNIFLFWGLKYIPSSNSGIILGCVPAIILILSASIYRERLNYYKITSVILAFLSIWLINYSAPEYQATVSHYIIGIALVSIAAIGEALFLFISKSTSSRVNPFVSASIITFFGFLMILPLSIWEMSTFQLQVISFKDMMIILYFGCIVTFLGYVLWFKGTALIPSSESALFTTIMPVSAVYLSYLILNEKLEWQHYIALLMVVFAIYLSIYKKRNKALIEY